jgi:hypothetical protein
MPDVRLPDGRIIKNVPDGMTRSQLQARLDKMNPATGYNETAVSQGLSGANSGIAATLGFPVDVANMAIGAGAAGINALTGSKFTAPEAPVLGSQWIKNNLAKIGTIGPESKDFGNKVVRRVGESVGAAAVPIAGTATTLPMVARALVPAVTGGFGAAVAKDVAPDNPWAELAGETIGSGLGGGAAYLAAKSAAKRSVAASVPTIPKLKKQASDMYALAERNGVLASKKQTANLADTIRQVAEQEGLISPTGRVSEAYPKAKEALQLSGDYAQGTMTPKQMQTVRKVLSEAAGSTDDSERRIARKMLEQFDDWTAPLAPELKQARGIARRYINAEKLETARELAAGRAGQFSGSGFENALRTEYRNLDRQIIKGQERGFTPETVEAIERVSRGTRGSNAARYVGKMAPTGVVSGAFSTGVPFAIGNAVGGPIAGATAMGVTNAAGLAGRKIATAMGINQAALAELIARNGGRLPPAMVFTPEVQRLIAAQSAGQLAPYLNKAEVKKASK